MTKVRKLKKGALVLALCMAATAFAASAASAVTMYDYGQLNITFNKNKTEMLGDDEYFQAYYQKNNDYHGRRSATHYYTMSSNGLVSGYAYSEITYVTNSGNTVTYHYDGMVSGTGWLESNWVDTNYISNFNHIDEINYFGKKVDQYGNVYTIDRFKFY